MNFIDTNAWSGSWPFGSVSSVNSEAPRVSRVGYEINEALISPFDAVFQTDPMPGNRANFKALAMLRSFRPLPILNPATPAWKEHLEEISDHGRVVAVRLLPAYHGYSLRSASVKKLIEELAAKKLKLVITARLVDERQEHPALSIKPISIPQIKGFLDKAPELHPLIQGLGVHELKELSTTQGAFSTDTSFAEWEDTLRVLKADIPVSRILFGSLSPLQVAQAQFDKVRLSSLPRGQRDAVAMCNAQSFFDI
ncbi:hypothetical protein F7C95_06270 [Opitutia bacterium ISCC 51]|nr:hypothetical protein F7C95_06270 [Opitutae bacterium ISCC 51]QXD29567.1 hypothetical protein GA003_06240 [Opitutae bacterium ISCC 52]